MSQAKKSLYDLYPRLTDTMVNGIRPMLPKGERKKKKSEILGGVFSDMPHMLHSLDFLIMSEESLWERHGSQVIFPESPLVLDNFAKARFNLESSEGFRLPFESFMLAMPHGYSFMGTVLPGLLVTFIDYFTSQEQTIFPFCDALKLQRPNNVAHNQEVRKGARALSISYRDPKNSQGYARMLVSEDKIPSLLKANSNADFESIMGYYHDKLGVLELDEHDLDIQFKAVRLIAALGVYNLATEGERLKTGFPGQVVPRMNFKNPDMPIRMTTLSSHAPSQIPKNSPESHYRTWHIRQLRDERYYRGKFENLPRGSRFVFVPDSVVNASVSPNTQF